ncbi:DNA helicase related protein [Pyrococcus sp. NA2]|nr:bifunctional RecB family nuclease/DEAD/DEAH box helicase [Pyrococcus sp. NA2]AEC51558.1 DNA helicase related protein [Pyrococcus sp. NA2]
MELHPSEIARFFELDECPRFLILLEKKKRGELERYREVIEKKEKEQLALTKWGEEFELEILQELRKRLNLPFYGFFKRGEKSLTRRFFEKYYPKNIIEETTTPKLIELLRNDSLIYQAPLSGRIGRFNVRGFADFIIKLGDEYYLLEAKFTKEEKLSHRLQTVMYAMLLSKIVRGKIKIAVLTKDNFPWPREFYEFPGDVIELIETIEEKLREEIRGTEPWITARCTTCQFEAICLSDALRNRSLGLLGIPPGDAKILKKLGVKDIDDLANLVRFKSDKPSNFEKPEVKDYTVLAEITKRTGLNIIKLARIAQVIRNGLNGKIERGYIPGTGYNLPHDNGNLVKVFIYLQKSPITDTIIGIGGLIKSKAGEKTVVEVVKEPPLDVNVGIEMEEKLLERFFRRVISNVKNLSPTDEVYPHLYFYTRGQREDLVDALRRHRNLWWSKPIRALLSLRKAIDWEGFSILKDELIDRHALPFAPGLGIIPVAVQFNYKWKHNESFKDIFEILGKWENGEVDVSKLYSIVEYDPAREPYYPILNRDDDEIPFTPFWKALVGGKLEDLKDILSQVVKAMAKIEEEIPEEYKAFTKKEGIPREEFENFDIEAEGLRDVLIEYLLLEFHTRKNQLERYYRLPPEIRAYSEKSAIIRVEKVEKDCIIKGKIVLPDNGGFKEYSPNEVLVDIDEDSWVYVTPYEELHGDPARIIKRSPLGIVEYINHENGEVVIKLININRGRFTFHHNKFTCRSGWILIEGNKRIRPGSYIILDPAIDDLGMSRAYEVLKDISTSKHEIYEFLNEIYEGNTKVDSRVSIWRREDIEEFLDHLPHLNEEQRNFVLDVEHKLVTLQGPPGTGKTAGAIAPAILARAYSMLKHGKSGLFIVTALSHRAVNEALIKTAQLLEKLKEEVKELNDVKLIRGVAGEEAIEPMKRELEGINVEIRSKLKVSNSPLMPTVTILFATPQTVFKLVDSKAKLIIIDEASMIDLPMFLLATRNSGGQVLLVGDHRQMQPIQVHEWELEDRKTIEEHLPFLSALNFIRFLRGELDERELKRFKRILGRDPPKWDKDKNDILPMHRLRETFRLPQALAELHSELFYSFDGIKLRSRKKPDERIMRALMNAGKNDFLKFILNPDYPVVLVTHSESSSSKVNELEAEIVKEIVEALGGVDIGVVVPYRAQKRLIRSLVDVQVDTVERFQGGEKDVIIVSMTSSDPSYLSKVMDFLYDPNRLNVAGSRAKEKLILIASKNLFTLSARDLDTFEILRPWKKFYIKMKSKGESKEFKKNGYNISAFRWAMNHRKA